MMGWILSAGIALALIGLGVLVAPRRSSRRYGIILHDPRALFSIRAMGVQDVVIGGLLGLMRSRRRAT